MLALAALCCLPPRPAFAEEGRVAPLLIAHYYAWYDQDSWSAGATSDLPPTPYRSSDPSVMERQVERALMAGIDAFNIAWLGPANPTDANLRQLLPIAAARGFSASIGFETDSPFLRSRADITAALDYALATHAWRPGYLRSEGKPVLFFWRLDAIPLEGEPSPVAAWRNLRDEVDPYRETLWIAEGDRFEYLEVFDGIHPYSIAWSANPARTLSTYAARARQQELNWGAPKLWVATVMPGYDDTGSGRPDAFSQPRRDGGYYDESWAAALASRPDWIVITSWNEWVEGSQIEPSASYGDLYLEATERYARRWKGIAEATADQPAPGKLPGDPDPQGG